MSKIPTLEIPENDSIPQSNQVSQSCDLGSELFQESFLEA